MQKSHRVRSVLLASVCAAALAAGCSSGSSSSAARPTTAARLRIVEPTANQVTGPDVTLKFDLIGARVVPSNKVSGPLHGNQGHIHVSIDGKLVSMAYGTTQDLHGLKPGKHLLQAEFVATDHRPFKNRVITAVLFTVQ
ncbi:MAG TPA: hypothetical protein VHP57_02445 [Acidimicrobiia bacterium]|nr:hypothetical protein [Acidimicrobiia bacterium]